MEAGSWREKEKRENYVVILQSQKIKEIIIIKTIHLFP